MFSYLRDGGVESRDLEVGVGGRGAVPLHGDQPGWRHLVGVLRERRDTNTVSSLTRTVSLTTRFKAAEKEAILFGTVLEFWVNSLRDYLS